MNGIEMMIVNILNGIGFDPKEIMDKANNLINSVESSLIKLDKRLERIEKALNIVSDEEAKQLAIKQVIDADNELQEKLHDKFN